MDTSTASQNRRSRRSSVLLTATLEVDGQTVDVKLRNLSQEGALIQGSNLPAMGSQVVLKRNELAEPGRIVWGDGKHAGIAFTSKLAPEQVLRHVPMPQPKVRPDFRRPGLACRDLTPQERRLVESWVMPPDYVRLGE